MVWYNEIKILWGRNMKIKILKLKKLISIILLVIMIFSIGPGNSFALATSIPQNITNSFSDDAKTERNFTWTTLSTELSSSIEYCIKSEFVGFGKNNIISIPVMGYTVKTVVDKRKIYKVNLIDLKPGTEYIYRIGNSNGYSTHSSFRTEGENSADYTFINITDTQGTTSANYAVWNNTLTSAFTKFPNASFIIHTGDMVDNGENIKQWDMALNAVKAKLMNIPIMPAVGNHDAFNKNKLNISLHSFTDRYNLPVEIGTDAPAGTVYSFDYGDAHIAVLNTEAGSKSIIKQAAWLKKDMLESSKAWKIVALHRGPYGSTYDLSDIRKALVPTFDEIGVDLVLQGHDHNYMRSKPMLGGYEVSAGKGTVYINSNSGGVKFYPAISRTWQAIDLQPKVQMYLAITVSKIKLSINAYDIKGKLYDSYIMTN